MSQVVRLALVDPSDVSRNSVKNLLLGIDSVWLEAECSRYEFFTDIVNQTSPDLALVVLDSDTPRGLALIGQITQQKPNCAVLAVSRSTEGSTILQAMRNGAKEFLNAPLRLDDFLAALDRITSSIGGRKEKSKSSQVITVCGASGGVGCTSLAINMACMLAQSKENSVGIIDLDFALGDTDVWLDIIPDYTIQDLAENINRLDYAMLKRSLTQHASGAFLLPRPVHLDTLPPIAPDQIQRVVGLLRSTFTHLIVDVSKSYMPLDVAAMQVSDTVLVITQLDLPSLRNVVRLIQFLDERELGSKLKIVVNRVGLEDSHISLKKALETIGRDVFWQIPNEYSTMVESRNNGIPLCLQAPRARITKSLEQMINLLESGSNESPSDLREELKPKRRLFSFLGAGAK